LIRDNRKRATLKEWLANSRQSGLNRSARAASQLGWMVNQRGEGKIYFDRPRTSAFLEKALDKVRAAKHRELGVLEKKIVRA
jgi:hypothetical protein